MKTKKRKIYFAGKDDGRYFTKGNSFSNVYLYPKHFKQFYHRNNFEICFTIHDNIFKNNFEYDASNKAWLPKEKGRIYLKDIASHIDIY